MAKKKTKKKAKRKPRPVEFPPGQYTEVSIAQFAGTCTVNTAVPVGRHEAVRI